MKKYIFYLLSIILFSHILSCSKSDDDSSTSSTSSPAYQRISGNWKIFISGSSETTNISAGSNFCNFDNKKFSGSWSGNYFSGTFNQSSSGTNYYWKLNLTLETNTSISGSLYVKITVGSYSGSNSDNFTGTKQ
jgi:hypothetical protein